MRLLQGLFSVVKYPFARGVRAIRFLVGPWTELWFVKQYQVELLQALSEAHALAHDLAHTAGKSQQSLRDDLQAFDKRLSAYISAQEVVTKDLTDRIRTLQSESHSDAEGIEKSRS